MFRMDNIGIVIQARLSSVRLPGKVLRELIGKPMIQHLIERLDYSDLNLPWIIATSDTKSDDPLFGYCQEMGYPIFRGPLENVADRFVLAAKSCGWEHVVRICGDSPLLDIGIIEKILQLYQRTYPDLATNVWPRSFPKGQSVEIFKLAALEKAIPLFQSAEDQEHVTLYFYKNPQAYQIENFKIERNLSHLSLAVDTPMDWERTEKLMTHFLASSKKLELVTLFEALGFYE